MTIPSEPRTQRLYHAGSGSAFPLLAAIGIVMVALACFVVAAVLVFHASHSTVLAVVVGQLLLGGIAIGATLAHRLPAVALGWTRSAPVFAVAAVLIGTSLWYVNLRLVELLRVPDGGVQGLQDIVDGPSLLVVLGALAVLPAICEELLFRGLLLRALAGRFVPYVAIVISALVFAGYHMSVIQLIPTFVLGLVAGVLTLRSGSVVPAMIVHVLNNGIALLVARGELPAIATRIDAHPTLTLGITALSVGAGLALVARRGSPSRL